MTREPTTEFEISIHDLDVSGRDHSFPIRAAWLTETLETDDIRGVPGDGRLNVRVSKSGVDVVVHGELVAELEVHCARCLGPARIALHQPLSVLLVPETKAAPSAKKRESELSAEDADVLTYSGDQVALDDLVRDEILLAIPMIPLCSESCEGMSAGSQKFEQEPEIDPRLLPLMNFGVKAKS